MSRGIESISALTTKPCHSERSEESSLSGRGISYETLKIPRLSARNDNRHLLHVPRRSRAVDDVLAQLEESPARIADLTKGLTVAQLHAIPGPGEWSANDVLAHLRSCADLWGGCITTIIDEDVPTIRAISPRGWIKRTNYPDLKFRASLAAFGVQRAELLAMLNPLAPNAWSRTATVKAAGKVVTATVLDYAQRLAGHEHHHLEQFARIAAAVRTSSE
jgi:hypothetical protein